jgi:hypothetical protein
VRPPDEMPLTGPGHVCSSLSSAVAVSVMKMLTAAT